MLKAKHKAHSRSRHLPCWYHQYGMCVYHGAPIDYGAPHSTPMAYEADHRRPRSTHPDLMFAFENIEAAHVKCNRTHKDNREFLVSPMIQGEQWVRPTW